MATCEWDEFAPGWDSNDDVRTYAAMAFDSWNRKVGPMVGDLPNCRALDFGCGTGLMTEKLAPICGQVLAVDTSAKMLDVLRQKISDMDISNVTAMKVAVNATTVRENPDLASKFDLIVASSVCSFLPDYETTLCNLVSVLNPGGLFVQWDWLADMSVDRIRSAFEFAGLVDAGIEEAFTMDTGDESMTVVMGIGLLSTINQDCGLGPRG